MPGGVTWKGTDEELVDLLKGVWESCKAKGSPTQRLGQEGLCGKMKASACSLCGLLQDQTALDRLLFGRHIADRFISGEVNVD